MIFPDLARYDRVGIDTETTGLGFRDRPVGLSWATPDGQSGYMAWGHDKNTIGSIFDAPTAANNCNLDTVREWASDQLRGAGQKRIFHNAPFDLRMLAYVGITVDGAEDTMVAAPILNELEPAFSLNALSKKYLGREKSDDELNQWCAAAFGGPATHKAQAGNYWRAPGEVVAPYARGDTELTLALYDHLRPLVTAQGLDAIYGLETDILPIVTDMHLTGVRVDLDAAQALDKELTRQLLVLRETWDRLSSGADPGKTREIAAVFERNGIPIKTTAKGNPSIESEDLEHVAHPLAQTLVKLRRLTHYRDTFVRTYILGNADESGIVHGEFHALRGDEFGAVSGRFSSGSSGGSLNLQNLPKRNKEFAPQIRGLFVPYHRGWHWLKADYSQIQFRFLAHYAALIGHKSLARTYHERPQWALDPKTGEVDFHLVTAGITAIPRDDAKHINFGCVFGMGVKKLAKKLGISEAAAERMLDEYHSKLPDVRATYDAASRRANDKGEIVTYGGRVRRFPSAEDAKARGWSVRDNEKHVGCHKGLNALLQGSEADLVKQALVGLRSIAREHGALLHMTVHDEFDWSVAPDQLVPFGGRVRELMQDCKLQVPVLAEVTYGKDWGHAETKLQDLAAAA